MSLINSIFCALCQDPYDDINKRPRLGVCFHLSCEECQSKRDKDTCPVCGLENSFEDKKRFNWTLIEKLKDIREQLAENTFNELEFNEEKINIWTCLKCQSNEMLRLCWTCSEASGAFKKLPNGSLKFQILGANVIIQLTKLENALVCSDCICNGVHENHEFIKFSHVQVTNEDLELWYWLVYGLLLERKLEEEKKEEGYQRRFKERIIEFKKSALEYVIFQKLDSLKNIEDQIKLVNAPENIHANINSIPELVEAKEKSFQLAKNIFERNQELRERQLMYKKEDIDQYLKYALAKSNKSENENEWKWTIQQLKALSDQFGKFCITPLNPKRCSEIDNETVAKMNEAEALQIEKEPIEIGDYYKFFKLRALRKQIENVDQQLKIKEQKLLEGSDQLDTFFFNQFATKNQIKTVASWENSEKISYNDAVDKLFIYETTDKSFSFDKLIIEYLEAVRFDLQTRLMQLHYFPETPYRTPHDDIYMQLLKNEYDDSDDKSWMHNLLFPPH